MEVTLWVSCLSAIADNFYLRFWARVPTSKQPGRSGRLGHPQRRAPYPLS